MNERDFWKHLYHNNRAGSEAKTSGVFSVRVQVTVLDGRFDHTCKSVDV